MPAAPFSARLPAPRHLHPILLLALAAYGSSLAVPAFTCEQGKGFLGYEVLMTGWVGLLALDPRWLANPLALWMFGSALFRSRGRYIVLGAVFTLVLAVGSLLPAIGCAGDAGSGSLSLGLGPGGYLWVVAVSAVAICAMREAARREAAAPLPPPVVRPVDAAVHAALADLRTGHPARTRCPDCRALILLEPGRPSPGTGAVHVTVVCACGACDGKYEVRERPEQP